MLTAFSFNMHTYINKTILTASLTKVILLTTILKFYTCIRNTTAFIAGGKLNLVYTCTIMNLTSVPPKTLLIENF